MTVELSPKAKQYDDAIKNALATGNFIDGSVREKALATFQHIGLPTKKNENYKYTNIEKSFPEKLDIATQEEVTANELLTTPAKYTLVFDNGEFEKGFSELPEGVTIEETTSLERETNDPLEAINESLSAKKYVINVAKNTKPPLIAIIHRLQTNKDQIALTHLSIKAATGSESEFLEVFHSQDATENFSVTRTHLELAANARLSHMKALLTTTSHSHVGKVTATLDRDANLNSLTFSVDGKLNRNNIEVDVNGTGAHASVNGLYTGRDIEGVSQHQDCFTLINHYAAHTTSDQVFKGILDDTATGAFTGKIVIHRDAQQVDSNQLNKNLLLSQKANVDTRPQIEVYADDVKCGHGATVGQINDEEVFYLESRGIPKEKAQKILCHAFAFEAIERCENAEVSAWLGKKLFDIFEKYALEKINSLGAKS